MMEEDEQFYKKLMALMQNNKDGQLKINNGKKIFKISIEPLKIDQSKNNFQNDPNLQINHENSLANLTTQPIDKCEVHHFDEIDFNLISTHMQPNQQQISEHFENLQLLNFEIAMQKISGNQQKVQKSQSMSQSQKIIIHQINRQIQQTPTKQKKVVLGSKNKKKTFPANEAVLNFIQNQNQYQNKSIGIFNQPSKQMNFDKQCYHKSFDIYQQQETCKSTKKLSTTTVNQSIQFLKQLHPEDKLHLQLISQRMMELEKVEKDKLKLDEQISQILSSSLSNSMRFDSFDISMFSSFRLGMNSDPLCQLFAQYLKRNSSANSVNKSCNPSFLFLYSQPMLDIHGKQIYQQINYFEEESIIQKVLKQIKCKIDYTRQRATLDKFHYWIKQGVQIIHFCGHGVQQKQNYLLFQNNIGKSVKMDPYAIQNILKQLKNNLKLVFVASCHSQSTGKVFQEAGADHVICIKNDYAILDDACQQFVKIFYYSCIHDKLQICEAFKFAKKQLQLLGKFSNHQIQKFILLFNHPPKNCSTLSLSQAGQFKDLTTKPFYNKNIPSRVQNFIPRPNDLYEILKLIDAKRRFISIIGAAGIGKSTLVRELVRYVQFRNIFKDGVVYTEIRSCQSISKILQTLDLQLFETSTIKHNRTVQQNIQKLVKQIQQKNILIVMDNCQNIMASEDKEIFKKMIESIMKNCDNVYFVFTNRTSLSRQIDYCSQKLYQLHKLNQKQSYSLFFQTIPRNVNKKQLEDFFFIEQGINQAKQHPIFQFLNGHPQAICMTASLLSQRTLPQLYQLLLKPFQDLSSELGLQQKKFNLNSNRVVQTAMKISLNVLKNKHKQASQMIKILSMLPKGLDSYMLSIMCSKKWKQTASKLVSHSLVKKQQKNGSVYYSIHPQIIVYVQNQISHDQKLKYHQKICDQYLKRCDKIYKNVGTLSNNSQKMQQLFLNEEDNFKAIILRQLWFYGQKNLIKRLYSTLFQEQYLQNKQSQIEQLELQHEHYHSNKPLIDIMEYGSMGGNRKRILYNQKVKQTNKKQNIMIFIVLYVTNLFVIKKALFCEKYIEYGVFLASKKKQQIIAANLIRIKACIQLARNKISQSKIYFQVAWELFALEGCGLGSASCEAAVGYIKYIQQQYAMAKMNLQNALKYYNQISHPFGKHYLNRWLCQLKSKMNRTENELSNHKKQAQKLLKQAKIALKSSGTNINNTSTANHKLGVFVFRYLFDNMSIFLQVTLQIDVKPKIINQTIKKVTQEKFLETDEVKNNNILGKIDVNYKRTNFKAK